ncbi:MAG: hypothetical protein IKT76_07185, partial [Bacteroides sp.]|nr:hypothetical protein [Bacteroides sp.]
IYADVTGKEIEVTRRTQAAAAGSAILAASAAGIYPDAVTAVKALSVPAAAVYKPDPKNTTAYESLYQRYCTLSEQFAKAPH